MTVNKIGVEGAKAISIMLQVNTTLTSLDLSCKKKKTRKKKEKGVMVG